MPQGLPPALRRREARLRVDPYLYAALDPTTGESFCLYLPGMDGGCFEVFLEGLSEAYPDHHLLVVLDGAPSHRSEQITHPDNVSLLGLSRPTPRNSTR